MTQSTILAWCQAALARASAILLGMEPSQTLDTLVTWIGKENCRHNVRVICDLEGLIEAQKDDLSSTMNCESGYNTRIVMFNCENGFVNATQYDPAIHGEVLSKDVGICQINSYWHIGPGKDFPSEEYVLDNPEACVRWACKQWLAGNGRLWVCKLKNLNTKYSS